MTAKLPYYKQCIAEILNPNEPLVNSKLVYLSDLSCEDMELLEQAWLKTNVERRQQIISHLVTLSEADFKLDFGSTFTFCLNDPDETVRTQAIAGLEVEENHLLITQLIRSLKEDSSTKVRAAAATALGRFAMLGEFGKLSTDYTARVYTALLEVLKNRAEPVEVKRRALEAVAPFNLPQVKELIEEACHSSDIKVKSSAIYAMGRNCNPVWLNTLIAELESNEAEIRYEAASACGEIGAEKVVPYLVRLIEDNDTQVQEAAIKALGEIGGEEAKQTLYKLAKNPQPRIRQAAKSAFKELEFCEGPLSLSI